ncbi:MAG: sulfatase-like hydrolase/transferase [Gemmatimonadetes bacterium]|nr:sulfatase-like hydrolase/transferase [Gemmatimonadota bacterium]NIO31927.1 sulfatase-like hydrolase/transferase [Gemmatimonadota bacterium]
MLIRIGFAALALSAGLFSAGGCSGSERAPNIVLIFTDDQGYADVGVYGATGYSTPHLDRLASEGMRFTDFYVSQAVCSASRISLLTGSYAQRVSILGALGPFAEVGINPAEETIAEMLRKRGYATGVFGKWHLGHLEKFLPLQHGFDEYLGLPYSNDMWPIDYDGRPATGGNKASYPPLPLVDGNETVETIDDLEEQGTLTTRYTERAVSFIERHKDEPFFLYLAHSMAHVPLGVSEKFKGHSAQGMYGDVIEEIDWSVGAVLAALDRHGLAENTLVIFTSDNGPWLNFGNHAGSAGPFREGKGTAFEGGVRVPAIMRWPGRIEAGSISRRMASTIDILPTLAAISGAPLPEATIDGVNILPLLEGDETANPRDRFYYYYGGELRAVREGKWKRVYQHRTRSYLGVEPGNDGLPGPYSFPTVPTALYDLENDIGETTDVSAAHPEVVQRLDALADSVRTVLGDRLTDRRGTEVRPPGRSGFDRAETVTHLAVGASVTLTTPPSPRYPGQGPSSLTDGKLGSRDHHDERWLGFEGEDLEAVIDLGRPANVSRIGLEPLRAQISWIFLPQWVEFAVSADGDEWETVYEAPVVLEVNPRTGTQRIAAEVVAGPVRYVRVRARNLGQPPEWHAGAGGKAWLFVDEIVVEGSDIE